MLTLLLAGRAAAAPTYYSHYWIEGVVSEEGVPLANRQISLYLTTEPTKRISTITDQSGWYHFNVYDLEYFKGVPVVYDSSAYTVTVVPEQGETGGTENALLATLRGYITKFVSLFRPVRDTTPPTVVSIRPMKRGVSLHDIIVITFSKVMSQDATEMAVTLAPETRIIYDWQTVTNGAQQYSILRLMPENGLSPNKQYSITINDGAVDTVGNHLVGTIIGNFWTLAGQDKDLTPPEIVFISPADGDVNVSVRPSISILFTEAMNRGQTERALTLPAAGGHWTTSWVGSKLICTPGNILGLNSAYTVAVGPGAQDLSNNNLANPQSATFTTGATYIDDIPPRVIAVTGGREVGINVSTLIYFSEAMDPATITDSTIMAFDSKGQPLQVTVTWDPTNNVAILKPARAFDSYADYAIHVRTLCTDLAGNHLLREYRTTFRTMDVSGPVIRKVKFDGRGYVENDVISANAVISAEVSDSSGIDYNTLTIKLGSGQMVERRGFSAQDVYDTGQLKYQIAPSLAEGAFEITIEAFDVKSNVGSWTGKVRVFTGEVSLVPGTVAFPAPPKISPLRSQAAGEQAKVTMVYNLTGSADIDLQIYGPTGRMVWGRRFASSTPGGLAGYNAVDWNGQDVQEQPVGNGIYAFRIVRGGKVLGTSFIIVSD